MMKRSLPSNVSAGWDQLQALARRADVQRSTLTAQLRHRWAALPEPVRSPGTLATAGLSMALLLLLAFYLTVQASVDRAEQRREATAACRVQAPGDARTRCAADALAGRRDADDPVVASAEPRG